MVDRIKIPTTTTTVPPLWQYCSMVMSATFADRSPMVRPETMMPKMTMESAVWSRMWGTGEERCVCVCVRVRGMGCVGKTPGKTYVR